MGELRFTKAGDNANRAVCDFDLMQTQRAANHNQGIIINAACSSYEECSSRSSYFRREFFCHDTAAPRS